MKGDNMNGTCKRCGKTKEGENYRLAMEKKSPGFLQNDPLFSGAVYEDVFLCSVCAATKARKEKLMPVQIFGVPTLLALVFTILMAVSRLTGTAVVFGIITGVGGLFTFLAFKQYNQVKPSQSAGEAVARDLRIADLGDQGYLVWQFSEYESARENTAQARQISHTPAKIRTVEEIIADAITLRAGKPLCWIVCYEHRPLQGTPPGSTLPHLLVFSSPVRAMAFIEERKKVYTSETLSVVPVLHAIALKALATAPSQDTRYAAPPCGLLLNFTYPQGASDGALSPQEVVKLDDVEIPLRLNLS
jgi:hypothetical protein